MSEGGQGMWPELPESSRLANRINGCFSETLKSGDEQANRTDSKMEVREDRG
jgi:hypothetical protein